MIQYQNISDPVEQLDFEDRIVTIANGDTHWVKHFYFMQRKEQK